MNFEIEYFDEQDNCLTFYVTVTDYVNVAPQGKWADSDLWRIKSG